MTTRGKGQSALAALGFAVVRRDPSGSFTRTLTGTSMAAATFSGIAAALWSRSDFSPEAVVRELYEASGSLPVEADFAPAATTNPEIFTQVRHITRCSAAGEHGLAACTSLPVIEPTVPETILPDPPSPEEAEQLPIIIPPPGVNPFEFPWVRPQPEGEPGCGACGLKLRYGRLDLSLRPSFLSKPVSNMRLLVTRHSAMAAMSLSRGSGLPGEAPDQVASFVPEIVPFSVTLDQEDLGVPTAAELAYQIQVDGVWVDTTEPVLIEPDQDDDATGAEDL
jgi:hypothetical protein